MRRFPVRDYNTGLGAFSVERIIRSEYGNSYLEADIPDPSTKVDK